MQAVIAVDTDAGGGKDGLKDTTRQTALLKPLTLGKYDGCTPLDTFVAKFRSFARHRGWSVRAKLQYTDTGYEHHQRTRSQQFCNLLSTNSPPTDKDLPHLDLCFGVAIWHICCRIVVSSFVGGVRSRRPCSGVWADVVQANLTGYGHVVACPLVVSVAAVRVVEFGPYRASTISA